MAGQPAVRRCTAAVGRGGGGTVMGVVRLTFSLALAARLAAAMVQLEKGLFSGDSEQILEADIVKVCRGRQLQHSSGWSA